MKEITTGTAFECVLRVKLHMIDEHGTIDPIVGFIPVSE